MRVAILANDRASFVRPTAEGLARMLRDCGADAHIHYDGISNLMRRQHIDFTSARSFAASTARLLPNRRSFSAFADSLRGTDVIVVVANVPGSFSPLALPNVEALRGALPTIPIVNYDLHYLPTLESWSRAILRGEETRLDAAHLEVFKKGMFGMERYDWYLMASVGTHVPMPPGPHPYTVIGLDLDDGSLFPDQHGRFRALLDFKQKRKPLHEIREVQLEALRLSGFEYLILEKQYSIDEIRAVYRESSILFLAHAESFGLPICEMQACGAYVFTPNPYWVTPHWLGNDYYSKRTPRLSSNFIVYENTPEELARQIRLVRSAYDPLAVRETFLREQPQLFRGDRAALKEFLNKIERGEIHSRLHLGHREVGRVAAS